MTSDRKRQILDTPAPSEDQGPESPILQDRADRHYESGHNTDMQVQRSNRQGSGIPTQQRKDDR